MEDINPIKVVVATCIFIGMCFAIWITSVFCSVWSEGQAGRAELARAEFNRTIKVLESDAFLESSKRFADAEVIRAEGVAKANAIIGESLKGNEAYLRYRWIEGLQTNQMMTIYVPTEAGLPILEAGRFGQTQQDLRGVR